MEPKFNRQKGAKNILSIKGTRAVLQSGQLITSSGIPMLDSILGGGLPVGSLILLEEDKGSFYSQLLLKYFLAEGVVNKHGLFVASQDLNASQMVRDLPGVVKNDTKPIEEDKREEKLTIAFRYQKVPTSSKKRVENVQNLFDLSKTMNKEYFEDVDVLTWPDHSQGHLGISKYGFNDLLLAITDKLEQQKYFINSDKTDKSVLRLVLHSLGSPMWLKSNKCSEDQCKKDVNEFIYKLRALLRYSFGVAVITVPSHLYSESFMSRLYNLSDIVLKLESFAGTPLEKNPALSDFHGYFHVKKVSAINMLVSKHPGPVEYVFKVRMKRFSIEVLHLPPDLSDENDKKRPTVGCGTASANNLDF